MKFVCISGQSFFQTPVSGGDFINFDLLKGLRNYKDTYLIINDITLPYAKENLKCNISPIKDFLNLNKLVQKHLFLAPLAFLNSTLKIIKILKTFKEPLIFYSSGDFICNIFSMVSYKKRFPESKIIIRVHHLNENPFKRKGNSFLSSVFSYFLQRTSLALIKKNADLIILLNKGVRDSLIRIGFSSEKLVVMGVGIDLEKIKLVKGIKRDNLVIYFGRLSKTKGIFDLPKIMPIILKQVPDAKLVMIGFSSEKIVNKIKQGFYKVGALDNIDFRGYIKEKDEIYQILNNGKVFILPSYEEGWGITIFEAIACGLAPVVYDLPIFKEIFNSCISRISLGDFPVFAQRVIYLLRDNQARENYNFMLREKIKHYNLNSMVSKEIELINGISNTN